METGCKGDFDGDPYVKGALMLGGYSDVRGNSNGFIFFCFVFPTFFFLLF